jgi:hypothetical protein
LLAAPGGASSGGVRRSRRDAAGQALLRSALLSLAGLAFGCPAIDGVETPNGDVDFSPDEAANDADSQASSDGCRERGWTLVLVAGRDQLSTWSAPSLVPSCSAAPHRLTALAPETDSSLSLEVSVRTGQVVEATYTTTNTGADGEAWGEYVAPIDVERLSFGAASAPTEQPFAFAGTILGPFGPVPITMIGCARVRPSPC